MYPLAEKAREYLWPKRRYFEGVVVVGSVLLLVAYQFLDGVPYVSFTVEQNILITTIFILLFLEGMATELTRATERLGGGATVISSQEGSGSRELERELSSYITEEHPDEVRMIEYSSSNMLPIIKDAAEEGAKVKVLVRHPCGDIHPGQPEKIFGQVRTLHSDLRWFDDLRIRFYKQDASLRARKFDEELINCGWYTHVHDEDRDGGTDVVRGHYNPSVAVRSSSTEEFEHLEEMFDYTFGKLWKHGESPEEVYRSEEYDNRDVENFRRWVDSQSCMEWVEQISKAAPEVHEGEP